MTVMIEGARSLYITENEVLLIRTYRDYHYNMTFRNL
jgi:hypothetical protein